MIDETKRYTKEDFDRLMLSGKKVLMEPIAGDTDSIYFYENELINSIKGSENWTLEQKRQFLIDFNTKFLDAHNKIFMESYFKSRNCRSMIHEFELETISLDDIRLAVKKRYAQRLCYKDGALFDWDALKFKSKGLEVIKSSYPAIARKFLKEILIALMKSDKTGVDLGYEMNNIMINHKNAWMSCSIGDICENKSINNYNQYIISDTNPLGIEYTKGAPYHVRALAHYNWCIKAKGEVGEEIYGGKCKVYPVKKKYINGKDEYFAFQHGTYRDWCEKHFPCDRLACFQKFYLDPINRVLSDIKGRELNIDGRMDVGLFDDI